MVNNEVSALVAADSGLTLDACTTKCDALFDFIDATDEATTDKMCASACDWYVHHYIDGRIVIDWTISTINT